MPSINLAARGRITTRFGQDINRGFLHRGIDQGHGNSTAEDLEIRSPAAGVVMETGRLGSYGKRLEIRHDDRCTSLLAHHAEQFVRVGQRVQKRELVAEMGNTGTIFVHSHQELRDPFGNQLDPLLYLSDIAGSNLPQLIIDTQESDDVMRVVLHKESKGVFVVAQEYIAHMASLSDAEYAAKLLTAEDVIEPQDTSKFQATLKALGIPFQHPDRLIAEPNQAGKVWSRATENAVKLDRLLAKLGA
jgi:murein DD-endopeptidase MepM/ murein hydrolase activator NlpD